jgi:5'-3' exonuclease
MTKSKDILASKKDMGIFMRKLAMDFAYETRKFEGLIDRIVFTLDSRSWRKDFYPEADYKGNRKGDKSINWENFSKVTEEFENAISKRGVILHKVQGAEGDDLMYAWNVECLSQGKSVILFTGDKDMIQLVNHNETTQTHTLLYSPVQKKLYAYKGFAQWLGSVEVKDDTDLFAHLSSQTTVESMTKKLLTDVVRHKSIAIVEVNPEEVAFKKVLTGDSGDNVSPIYSYTTTNKKGHKRTYGVSENKAQLILDEFEKKNGAVNSLYFFTHDYIIDVANIAIRVLKAKHMSREQIMKNIKTNANLVLLNSKTIPPSILEEMFRTVEIHLQHEQLDIKQLTTMDKVLEGTSYSKDDSSKMTSNTLDDIKDSDDYSFIIDRKQKGKVF